MQDHKLILIIYYGRSGSAFIHSLLDGHPEIISMPPVIMNFIEALEQYKPDLGTAENAFRYFIRVYGSLVNSLENNPGQDFVKHHSKSMNFSENPTICALRFKQCFYSFYNLLSTPEINKNKLLFLTMHYAYDAMLNGYSDFSIADRKKIVFQLHNPVFVPIQWYAELFDGAYLLQMVRSPLVTLRSLMMHWIELGGFNSTHMYNILRQVIFGATLFDYQNVDHFAVRLEDIHCNPRSTLEKIVEKLKINWHESLLTSTFASKPWGNVKGREHISGFMPETNKVDLSDIFPDKDIALLLPALEIRYRKWGYDLPHLSSSYEGELQNHSLLLEYVAFTDDMKSAVEQYHKQSIVFNSEQIRFYLRYGSRFNQPLVEVL